MKDTVKTQLDSKEDKKSRINKARVACHSAKISREHDGWYWALIAWRSEMNFSFNQEEKNQCEMYERNIVIALNHKIKIDSEESNHLRPRYNLDKNLMNYELFLGDLEFKYGFGVTKSKSRVRPR